MARRFLDDIDATGFSLLGAMLHPVTSDPAGLGVGDAGRAWVRTDTSPPRLMFWTGTTAVNVVDLASATGTLTASQISDFMTEVVTARLDELAAPTADVGFGGQKITGLADGTAGSDGATYGQLLQFLNNQSFKAPVRVASTEDLTLSGTQTIDGVSAIAGDRVLVKDQTAGEANGIYVVAAGAWSRSEDFNTSTEAVPGTIVSVQEGTVHADQLFMLATNGPITLGTTSLTFSAYGASSGEIGVAGDGLTKTGTTYDVGAGTGISVTADAVGIDTAVVARKVTGTIPTTTTGIFTVSGATVTINHALANEAVDVTVRYGSGGAVPGQRVEVGDGTSDANNAVLTLPAAPGANEFIVQVIG